MNKIVERVQKRAAVPGARLSYAIDDDNLALDGGLVVEAGPSSAVFCVSDEAIVDFDGDVVSISGISTDNFFNRGANWFLDHESKAGRAIGSSINPQTGRLDVWRQGSKLFARCHFYTDIPAGKFMADQVAKKRQRSCSIAFVPLSAQRRDDYSKSKPYGGSPLTPNGFAFHAADLTEISLVGISSNSSALLQMANDKSCPALVAKSLKKKCAGRNCQSVETFDDIADEIKQSNRSLWAAAADLPRRQRLAQLKADLDRITAKTVRGMDRWIKDLGSFSGNSGGYSIPTQQADLESADEGVYDRYGKIGRCKCPCGAVGKCGDSCMKCRETFDKSLESDGAGPTEETGEAALVDAGQVPPDSTKSIEDVCPECGEDIDTEGNWKFCASCGSPLEEKSAGDDGAPVEGAHDAARREILDRYGDDDDTDEDDSGLRGRYNLPQLPY